MALELYMLGLVVHDMGTSLEFYRRLGLAIPEGSDGKTHVEVKMGAGSPSSWTRARPAGPRIRRAGRRRRAEGKQAAIALSSSST